MLTFSVNTDLGKHGDVVTQRQVKLGETFQIAVVVEDDGTDPSPAEFDTLLVEILFNDHGHVLTVDPVQRPVAGDLLAHRDGARDAFTQAPVRGGHATDKGVPFSSGSELTLVLPPQHTINTVGTVWGPYASSTGHAGVSDRAAIKLSPRERFVVAMGKTRTGVQAAAGGTSSLLALGKAFKGSEIVPSRSVRSTVTVV